MYISSLPLSHHCLLFLKFNVLLNYCFSDWLYLLPKYWHVLVPFSELWVPYLYDSLQSYIPELHGIQ